MPLKFDHNPPLHSSSSSSNFLSFLLYISYHSYRKPSTNRTLPDHGSALSNNGRIQYEQFPTNSTNLGHLSLDPGPRIVPRLHPYIYRCLRASHGRLEPLCSSAVYLRAACVRQQTYLGVLVRMARDVFQLVPPYFLQGETPLSDNQQLQPFMCNAVTRHMTCS